jgi:ribosomal protein S18 acetylase RimI-like enzyme
LIVVFTTATDGAANEIVALHEAVAFHRRTCLELAGARPWNVPPLGRVMASMKTSEIILAHEADSLVACFRLDPARGFHGDARFTDVPASLYLLEMAVHPARRREGLGRRCLEEVDRRARHHGAAAIRLDTNDDSARAAAFYAACGYREVVRIAQTIYFERLL